jgi:hypothetical protein
MFVESTYKVFSSPVLQVNPDESETVVSGIVELETTESLTATRSLKPGWCKTDQNNVVLAFGECALQYLGDANKGLIWGLDANIEELLSSVDTGRSSLRDYLSKFKEKTC